MLISEVRQIESDLADARDHLADGYDLLDLIATGQLETTEVTRQSTEAAVRQQEARVRTLENQLSNAQQQLLDVRQELGEVEALPSETVFGLPLLRHHNEELNMEALRVISIVLLVITVPILAWSVYQIQKANRLKGRR